MEELIGIIETLCDGYRNMPCGCESCPYFDEDSIDEDGEFSCEVEEILNMI